MVSLLSEASTVIYLFTGSKKTERNHFVWLSVSLFLCFEGNSINSGAGFINMIKQNKIELYIERAILIQTH